MREEVNGLSTKRPGRGSYASLGAIHQFLRNHGTEKAPVQPPQQRLQQALPTSYAPARPFCLPGGT